MALLFMDGFDHYATADFTKKWTSINASPQILPTSGRRGGGAARIDVYNTNLVFKTFPFTSNTWILGFAFNSGGGFGSASLAGILDGSTYQCELRTNSDGTMSVTRNGTALTGGTSTRAMNAGTWNYIEWKVTIADSIAANSCVVRVNGEDWLSVAAGQDLKNSANAFANRIVIGGSGPISMTNLLFDDLYVCDQTGPAPYNNFLGDVRIDTLLPNGDGTYQAWSPSTGTTHYTCVDENPINTTDSVQTAGVGNRDSYTFQDLPALTGNVLAVQTNIAAIKNDAGSRSVKTLVKSGATVSTGTAQALNNSYLYYNDMFVNDPNTGTAWTQAAINAAEFGVESA